PILSTGTIALGAGSLDLGDHYGSTASTYSGAVTGAPGTLFYLTGGGSVSTFAGDLSADQVYFYDAATYDFEGAYRSNSTRTSGTVNITVPAADFGRLNVAPGTTTITGSQPSLTSLAVGGTLDLSAVTLTPGSTTLTTLAVGGTLLCSQDFTVSGLVQLSG